MTFYWYDWVGYLGVALILLAYFLLQAHKLPGHGLVYQLMNVVGAFGVILSLSFSAGPDQLAGVPHGAGVDRHRRLRHRARGRRAARGEGTRSAGAAALAWVRGWRRFSALPVAKSKTPAGESLRAFSCCARDRDGFIRRACPAPGWR